MRRRAVVRGAVAITALGLSALAGWSARRRRSPIEAPEVPPPQIAADTLLYMTKLRERLAGVQLGDDVLLRFIHDHGEAGATFELDAEARASGDDARRLLLSTDFFQTGARVDRAPAYARYYDPYRSPCYDPLAT